MPVTAPREDRDMRYKASKSDNSISYYALEEYRRPDGTRSSRVAHSFGTHKALLAAGKEDPEAYVREQIRILNEENRKDIASISFKLDMGEKLPEDGTMSAETSKNIGYAYISALYDKLGLGAFAKGLATKARYDADAIFRHCIVCRMLNPGSKKADYESREAYYGEKDFQLHDIYRFLTLLCKNSDAMQAALFQGTKKAVDLDTEVLFYDCTNFYFETETQDENEYDDDGDILQWGFRRYGPSKEHRPNPIVEMGLFTDGNGIPISYCIESGSKSEQTTVIPLEKRMLSDYGTSKFIYCSDAGLGSYENRAFNAIGGRNYIVTQSLKKMEDKELKLIMKDMNWTFLDSGLPASLEAVMIAAEKKRRGEDLTDAETELLSHDIICKTFPTKHRVSVKNFGPNIKGMVTMEETIHVTFSVKYYIYQRNIFERQLEAAVEMAKKNKAIQRKGPNDVSRFLEIQASTREGESAEEISVVVNEDAVNGEKMFHGFYGVATSLDKTTKEILGINARRWKIEQSFRIMKSEFDSRPAYVSTADHIKAHFAICYAALTLYRVMEAMLNKDGNSLTAGEIIGTMRNMKVTELAPGYCKSVYTGSKALNALEDRFHLALDRKGYRVSRLNKLFGVKAAEEKKDKKAEGKKEEKPVQGKTGE